MTTSSYRHNLMNLCTFRHFLGCPLSHDGNKNIRFKHYHRDAAPKEPTTYGRKAWTDLININHMETRCFFIICKQEDLLEVANTDNTISHVR